MIGACIADLLGGWDTGIQSLLFFMAIDYLTGLIVAGIFKNSLKTKKGALESCVAWKGLLRKAAAIIIVMIAFRLDLILSTSIIRNGTIIAYSANELLSITENIGLMGVPLPKPIMDAIEILKERNTHD